MTVNFIKQSAQGATSEQCLLCFNFATCQGLGYYSWIVYVLVVCAKGIYPQCNFTHKTTTFNRPHSRRVFNISRVITCQTNNVIYLLKWSLKVWISEHRSNVYNHDTRSPVATHFNQASHNVSAITYYGIEAVKPHVGVAVWTLFNTSAPLNGLNDDFYLRPFL